MKSDTNSSERIFGEKVVLRPINMDDTEDIVKWRNNPRVRKNFRFQEDFTDRIQRDWMIHKVMKGDVIQYIVLAGNEQKPIGAVYFRDIDEVEHTAEFGIFIGEEGECGKGYGIDATKTFVRYGIEKLGMEKIFLRVFEDNRTAVRCYERVGFIKKEDDGEKVIIDGEVRFMMHMEYRREL